MTIARRMEEASLRVESRVFIPLATAVLALFALWRVGIGADVSDGTHVVALAMRVAQGDRVLLDEMNLQAFGSLAAVPFVWTWMQVFGVQGIVLASRVYYVVLAFAVGFLAYRSLRIGLPPVAAFVAVVTTLGPVPYNLLVTSYNTMPVLALGLGTSLAFAALLTSSVRYAAAVGVAMAVAILSHPSSLPAAVAVALSFAVLARRPRAVLGLVAGGGAVSLAIILVIAVGPGLTALQDTIAYTTEYQAHRPSLLARGRQALERYVDGMLVWRHLPAFALAVLALLPRLSWTWRAVAASGIPVAVAGAACVVVPPHITAREPLGLLSGGFVLIVAPLLLLPVAAWAHRKGSERIRLLLLLTLPVAIVGMTSFSLISSANVRWGVAAPPVQPLFGALAAGLVLWATRHAGRVAGGLTALALVCSLLVVHPLRTFQNPDPRQLAARISDGPLAGLKTDANHLTADCELRTLVATWVGPHDSVFFYARPGGYAYSTAKMDTNILWLADFGQANHRTVEWWTKTGRWPDVAMIYPAAVRRAGGWAALATEDPVITALSQTYGPPTESDGYLVLRRDGRTPERLSEPPAGCAARTQ